MRVMRFGFATEHVPGKLLYTANYAASISSVQSVSPVLSSTNSTRAGNYALDWDPCHPDEVKPKTPADSDDHVRRNEKDHRGEKTMTTENSSGGRAAVTRWSYVDTHLSVEGMVIKQH